MPGGWCLFALSLPVMIMVKVWQKKFAQALWAGSGDGPGHLGSEVAFHRQPGKPHTQTHTNTDTDTGTNTNTNTHTHTHRHPLDLHSLAEEGGACHWKSRNPLSKGFCKHKQHRQKYQYKDKLRKHKYHRKQQHNHILNQHKWKLFELPSKIGGGLCRQPGTARSSAAPRSLDAVRQYNTTSCACRM